MTLVALIKQRNELEKTQKRLIKQIVLELKDCPIPNQILSDRLKEIRGQVQLLTMLAREFEDEFKREIKTCESDCLECSYGPMGSDSPMCDKCTVFHVRKSLNDFRLRTIGGVEE